MFPLIQIIVTASYLDMSALLTRGIVVPLKNEVRHNADSSVRASYCGHGGIHSVGSAIAK